jgi:glycosyltransferase involved in cell wall biosynthesis
MVSVVVLTKNEERDLPGCLDSLDWCGDIHVVDSGSSDRTLEVAGAKRVKISKNPFQSFAQQRNWAIDHCVFQHEWILFLDADERSTPEFAKAVLSAVESAGGEVAGFYCCWKMMLGNRWLKRSDNFPKWQFRLFRKGRARFIDVGHGQKEGVVQGGIEYLKEPYIHHGFSRGWDHWMRKHLGYARQEALERLGSPLNWKNFFSPHASKRNPEIKKLVGGIPCWPQLRFIYSYLVKGGFLEGKEGLEYCRKVCWYEKEIRKAARKPGI